MMRPVFVFAFVALCSCVDAQPRAEYCTDPAPPSASSSTTLTYHQDVAPILNARCGSCHAGQGPGPMRLTTWDDAKVFHAQIAAAILSRHMPPWPPARCCAEYERSFAMTDEEIATVLGWNEHGLLEGTPPQQAPAIIRRGLPRIDANVAMTNPYLPDVPEGRTDETRCFLLDWAPEKTVYLTGLDIKPGQPAQMHHGIVVLASADDVRHLQSLDDASPGDGWPCSAGITGTFKASLGGSFFEATRFAEGFGVQMQPTDRLVLTMHYSRPPTGGFQQDMTKVDLMFQEQATRPISYITVMNPSWVVGGLYIPAGATDQAFSYAEEPTLYNGGKTYEIRAVNLHMHERGLKGQVAVLRADGTRECLLQIDRWDHAWQGDYVLKTPVKLAKGDRVLVECRWDNSEGHQRTFNGMKESPRLLLWGEDQEMCIGFITASLAE